MTVMANGTMLAVCIREVGNNFAYKAQVSGAESQIMTLALCIGDYPSDAVVRSMSLPTDSRITDNTTVLSTQTFGVTYTGAALNVRHDFTPASSSFTCTKAGHISWAVFYYESPGFAIFDVTGPNDGGVIQLDKLDVLAGDTVKLLSFAFTLGTA